MFACRLLIGFMLATSASGDFRAAEPVPVSEPKPSPAGESAATSKPPAMPPADAATSRGVAVGESNTKLEPIARAHFEKGQYKEALDAYTRWEAQSFCGNGRFAFNGRRLERIAVCQAYLNDHTAAAHTCLSALSRTDCYRDPDIFLLQLYREAGQLDDLGRLLDAIEKPVIEKHPKHRLLTPEARAALVDHLRTGGVRDALERENRDKIAPWPDGVPKPKPGSLPTALPK